MIVRKLRLQKSWSQEYLSDMTGLSTRTIQRIERGEKPSLESLRLLSEALEVDVATLQQEPTMQEEEKLKPDEKAAMRYVRDIKGFYSHLIKYIVIIIFLGIINLLTSPNYLWVFWVMLGWGIGVASHALSVFEITNFFGPDWEKKKIEKRLGRKL